MSSQPIGAKLNLGCGDDQKPGYIGLDIRQTQAADIQGNALALPFRSNSFQEVYADNVLEHFEDPCEALNEIHRILSPEGALIAKVPVVGTAAAHIDRSHLFIADPNTWRELLFNFFNDVYTEPLGIRFPFVSEKWAQVQADLIQDGLWELANCFKFKCSKKKVLEKKVRLLARPWQNTLEERRIQQLMEQHYLRLKSDLKKEIFQEIRDELGLGR